MSTPGIPKSEHAWVGYYDKSDNLHFVVTSRESRDFYYLYKVVDGKAAKLGRARDPTELVAKHGVLAIINAK